MSAAVADAGKQEMVWACAGRADAQNAEAAAWDKASRRQDKLSVAEPANDSVTATSSDMSEASLTATVTTGSEGAYSGVWRIMCCSNCASSLRAAASTRRLERARVSPSSCRGSTEVGVFTWDVTTSTSR